MYALTEITFGLWSFYQPFPSGALCFGRRLYFCWPLVALIYFLFCILDTDGYLKGNGNSTEQATASLVIFVLFLFALVKAILEHLVYYYYLLFLCFIFLYWRLKWYQVTFCFCFAFLHDEEEVKSEKRQGQGQG